MKGSRSPGRAQQFPAAFSAVSPHFRPRHHLTAPDHHAEMSDRFTSWNFTSWNEVTGLGTPV